MDRLFLAILILSEQDSDMAYHRDDLRPDRGGKVFGDGPSFILMVLEADLHQFMGNQGFVQSMGDSFIASLPSHHDHRLELVGPFP